MPGDEAGTMTAPLPPSSNRAPTAAAAFLRGVQRRATALAWLQAGDLRRAGLPVAAAARAFPGPASGEPMERWPVLYWRLLLADPALRTTAPTARWPEGLAWLGGLSAGVRAVLLLRLVAQLEASAIAGALEVPVATVHDALRAALPLHPDGSHDPLAWQTRQAALRDALDALPATAVPDRATADAPRARPRWRGTRAALWAGVAACVLGFAATFVPLRTLAPGSGDQPPGGTGIPLAPSQAPVVAMEPELALLAHPDLEQLADAADASVVRELDFYAWYAARLAEQASSEPGEGGDAR